MHALTEAIARFAAQPSPSPSPTFDPDTVTPGAWGFVAVAFIAVAVFLLVWDMLRRIRRARYREEVTAELDAEEAAAAQAGEAGRAPALDDDPDAHDDTAR